MNIRRKAEPLAEAAEPVGSKTSKDTKRKIKLAWVAATFPELKGRYSQREGRGEGSTAKAAISRAIGDLLKSGKRKRFTTILAKVTVIDKQEG